MMLLSIYWEENLKESHRASRLKDLPKDNLLNFRRPALNQKVKAIKKLIAEGRAQVLDLEDSELLGRDQRTALRATCETVKEYWKEYKTMADVEIQIPAQYHGCKDIHIMPAHEGHFIIASPEIPAMIGSGKTPEDWTEIPPESVLGRGVNQHMRGVIRRRKEAEKHG
ncbi:MAG: hypothetical protein KC897_12365 [Candidatus Omnitrophica bacterium]|nr:hypothetical protein [Candidatus Omnitrophota bacterium]